MCVCVRACVRVHCEPSQLTQLKDLGLCNRASGYRVGPDLLPYEGKVISRSVSVCVLCVCVCVRMCVHVCVCVCVSVCGLMYQRFRATVCCHPLQRTHVCVRALY